MGWGLVLPQMGSLIHKIALGYIVMPLSGVTSQGDPSIDSWLIVKSRRVEIKSESAETTLYFPSLSLFTLTLFMTPLGWNMCNPKPKHEVINLLRNITQQHCQIRIIAHHKRGILVVATWNAHCSFGRSAIVGKYNFTMFVDGQKGIGFAVNP